MSPSLRQYIALRDAMLSFDSESEENLAESCREIMDIVWERLTKEEIEILNKIK